MEAILKCKLTNKGEKYDKREYSFHCTDKNDKVLSSAVGRYKDIERWIENDVLLQGICDEGYEPPPTSTATTSTKSSTTTTQKSTTTEYIPPSCDYLKFWDFD